MKSQSPAYMTRFQCIGPACEDNCCHSWGVAVDRDSFARWQRTSDPELKQLIRLNVVPQPPHQASRDGFAAIALHADGLCPFQTAERLCSMQVKLGGEKLCDTCVNYPRTAIIIDGALQRAARLSCPEAARLALLQPDAMEPTWQTEASEVRLQASCFSTAGLDRQAPGKHAAVLRARSLALLRRLDASIEARLMALGLALHKLTELQRFDRGTAVETFDLYDRALPALEEEMARLTPRHSIQIELLRELMVERFPIGFETRHQRYTQVVNRIAEAFRLSRDVLAGEEAVAAYATAVGDFYEPYVQRRPWVMENLLANYVCSTPFLIEPGRSLFDEYVLLVVRYALVKLHLVGLAAANGGLTDELLVEAVYLFQRAVDHDERYVSRALELLQQKDVNSMAFMAILIVS